MTGRGPREALLVLCVLLAGMAMAIAVDIEHTSVALGGGNRASCNSSLSTHTLHAEIETVVDSKLRSSFVAKAATEIQVSASIALPLSANVNKLHSQVFLPDPKGKAGFVFYDGEKYKYCEVRSPGSCTARIGVAASAALKVGLTTTGWDELTLSTEAAFPDRVQAYAAGYLEGALTWERISAFADSWVLHKHKPDQRAKINTFINKQDAYLRASVKSQFPSLKNDAELSDQSSRVKLFWWHIGLVLQQLDGMLAGYNDYTQTRKLTLQDMWLLNDDGDVLDIERFAGKGMRFKSVDDMTLSEVFSFIEMSGHCTALVKWTGNDLIVAHATWSDYLELIRMYKHYTLNYRHAVAKSSSHPSYPGMIYSSDDFYVLSSGLVVTETTITILNEKLYKKCQPDQSAVTVVRSLVANWLAKTAKDWVDIFSQLNSGTYNNQWMIIDMNRFHPGANSLSPGTLWVVEQIPGHIESRDMTSMLEKAGYWGSFNRPYFPKINEISMFKAYSKKSSEFNYQQSSRAKMVAREQATVKTIEDAKRLIRYNNFKEDEFSGGCPSNAIAARFDIHGTRKCRQFMLKANGATDAKITSYSEIRRGGLIPVVHAISGPTTSHGMEPFNWNQNGGQFSKMRSLALPEVFDFKWQQMAPLALPEHRAMVVLPAPTADAVIAVDVNSPALTESKADVRADEEQDAEADVDDEAEDEIEEGSEESEDADDSNESD